ncbi:Uncharacterised protein [Bordetella pseudohinzii]|uniref:Uncharacterized protein n=1 Tax=Bordetella pseudohinzii TaxID=1331258 RepID=A0A0M7H5N9_9BORD|nr:Uncharacterised protein [Bordetella pseudohinzii]
MQLSHIDGVGRGRAGGDIAELEAAAVDAGGGDARATGQGQAAGLKLGGAEGHGIHIQVAGQGKAQLIVSGALGDGQVAVRAREIHGGAGRHIACVGALRGNVPSAVGHRGDGLQLTDIDRIGGRRAGGNIAELEPAAVDAGGGDARAAGQGQAAGLELGGPEGHGIHIQVAGQGEAQLIVSGALGDGEIAVRTGKVHRRPWRDIARVGALRGDIPTAVGHRGDGLQLPDIDRVGRGAAGGDVAEFEATTVDTGGGDARSTGQGQPTGLKLGGPEGDGIHIQVARQREAEFAVGRALGDGQVAVGAGKVHRRPWRDIACVGALRRNVPSAVGHRGDRLQLSHIDGVGGRRAGGDIAELEAAAVDAGGGDARSTSQSQAAGLKLGGA